MPPLYRIARILAILAVVLNLVAACSQPQPPTVPLYRALQVGDLDQVKRHLAHGSPIDRPDANGDLPLHVAAGAGQVAIARALLDNGARLDVVDAQGHTPLHLALANGRVELARMLVDWGATDSPQDLLFALVREGSADRDALAFLSRRGADINGRDSAGQTPLHLALIDRRVAFDATTVPHFRTGTEVEAFVFEWRGEPVLLSVYGRDDLRGALRGGAQGAERGDLQALQALAEAAQE